MTMKSFDVCGSPALAQIEGLMHGCGYRRVDGRPREPGDYYVQHGDAAPGWSDWMWEVEALELTAHPITEVLTRYQEIEKTQIAAAELVKAKAKAKRKPKG